MKADFQSLKVPRYMAATYEWPVDYAIDVHDGEIDANGRLKPGRPWTDVALQRSDTLGDIVTAYQGGYSVQDSFSIAAHVLDGEFRDSIEDPIYRWPRATRRSDGQIVTSPRDIVDTGLLRDSQQMLIEVIR